VEPERDALAGRDAEPPEGSASAELQIDRRGENGHVRPATPGDTAVGTHQQRPDEPVLGARHVLGLELHLPGDSADLTQ